MEVTTSDKHFARVGDKSLDLDYMHTAIVVIDKDSSVAINAEDPFLINYCIP